MNFWNKLLLFIFILGAVHPKHLYAFIYINSGSYATGAQPISKAPMWSGRKVSFRINTNLSAYGGALPISLTQAQWYSTVENAIAAWSVVCNCELTIELAGTTSNLSNNADGVNTIVFDNDGTQFGGGSTLAWATPHVTTSYVIDDCDIVFNGNYTFGTAGESNKYDALSVMAHEMGHCLGLDHTVSSPTWTSNNSLLNDATMAATAGLGEIVKRDINRDDNDGISCMYQNGRTRNGDFCTSYHGTNGGAAISGVQTGGAQDEFPCSEREVTVATSGKAASGCVKDAVADSAFQSSPRKKQNSFPINEIFIFFFGFITYYSTRWFFKNVLRRRH